MERAHARHRQDLLAAGALALVLGVALQLIRGDADWGPSEGVYALSSRLFSEGGDLYGGLVASQPPWVYLFGGAMLSIADSLDWLRFACGLLQVATAVLAAEAVWRLTAHRAASLTAAALVVVTPWATHQHGLLLPEQLGAPLLLGAALLASRPATARWGGALAGVAVFAKLPFALPALLLVAASPGRWIAARWAAGALALQALLFTLVFGTGFWGQIVGAQSEAVEGLQVQIGQFVQAGWNLAPLLLFAVAGVWLRREAREPALVLTLAAAAIGVLATVITIVRPGTGLNVIVPSEPLLVTLGVAGAVWALRSPLPRRAVAVATGLALVFALAQSASLLLNPTNPQPFIRPLSATAGWKVVHTREEIDRLVTEAEACPPDTVYSGPELVAFIAERRVPADQPDLFIVGHASRHAELYARVQADGPRCP